MQLLSYVHIIIARASKAFKIDANPYTTLMSSVQSAHLQKPSVYTLSNPGLNKSNKCENFDLLNLCLVNIRGSYKL